MDTPGMEADTNAQIDPNPLLMAHIGANDQDHIINIISSDHAPSSSSTSGQPSVPNQPPHVDSAFQRNRTLTSYSGVMPTDGGHAIPLPEEIPPNSNSCLQLELIVVSIQIILSALSLLFARGENVPLSVFTWVASYACGCIVTLTVLLWRLWKCESSTEQFLRAHQTSSESNILDSVSYTALSATQPPADINDQNTWTTRILLRGNLRMLLNPLIENFKTVVDIFFGWWFVIGMIWAFDGSAPTQAAAMFGVSTLFLALTCIMVSMPISLVVILHIFLSPVIHIMSNRAVHPQSRGATVEAINSLAKYKFKKIMRAVGNHGGVGAGEAGILAIGTENERTISQEDAVCCICLAEYADDDELKELPCVHTFHAECVDKWLYINSACPLCQNKVQISSSVFCCPLFRLFC